MIRRGFLDNTYAMPLVALCNVSWEFIFSFLYPHGPATTSRQHCLILSGPGNTVPAT